MQLSLDDLNTPRDLTRAELMTHARSPSSWRSRSPTVLEWGRNSSRPRVKLGRHVRFITTHVEAAILEIEQRRRR